MLFVWLVMGMSVVFDMEYCAGVGVCFGGLFCLGMVYVCFFDCVCLCVSVIHVSFRVL